jgi:hypothetical protein
MAEKQGRLAKILEQEYKSKGIVSGSISAGSKRLKEIFDIRNVLFSGSGVGSILGRKIFGKGYSATPESSIASKISAPVTGVSTETVDVLISIKKDTRISAKNSMVLPAMARDMNLMRQNIGRLVKLQGGTSATKADMFFKRAGERETAYEAQFGKKVEQIGVVKSETKNETSKSGIFAGLLTAIGGIGAAIGGGFNLLGEAIKSVSTVLTQILTTVREIAISMGIGKAVSNLASRSLGAGAAAGIGAAAGAATAAGRRALPDGKTPENTQNSRVGGRGSPATKPSQRYGNIGAGGLSIQEQEKLVEKIKRLMKSPKAWAKFSAYMAKRGFAWVATALAATGPVGWIIAAILAVWTFSDIMNLIDEFMKEDTTPTNLKEEQQQMANLIYDRFREAGFDDNQARAAVANAVAESGLNPNAHNTRGEDSVGLFQMNRNRGLGTGYSVDELKDPETNIALAIDAAKRSKDFVSASSVEEATEAFVRDVERPKDKAGAIAKRTQIALDMQGTSLGSRVNGMSTEVADASRSLTTSPFIVNAPVNNNVQNNNNVQGGNVADTFNNQFNELLKLAMTQS